MSGGFVVSSIVVRRHEHLIVGRAHLPNESLDQGRIVEARAASFYACCPCAPSPASRKIFRVTKFHTMTTAVAKILVIR